ARPHHAPRRAVDDPRSWRGHDRARAVGFGPRVARSPRMNTTHPEMHRTVEVRGTHDATYQGYQILHWGFVALPVIAGLDKFAHLLTNWDTYLAPAIANMLGSYTHTFMLVVGA